jgi:hypothetical protein
MFVWDALGMTDVQVRGDDGDREMASTESELAHAYPDVTPDVIHALVQRAYTRLTPAKVHSYLPILVGRDVRARLRARDVA